MIRAAFLVAACLLAACSSDDAKYRAADHTILCDAQFRAFYVWPGPGDWSSVAAMEGDGYCAALLKGNTTITHQCEPSASLGCDNGDIEDAVWSAPANVVEIRGSAIDATGTATTEPRQ